MEHRGRPWKPLDKRELHRIHLLCHHPDQSPTVTPLAAMALLTQQRQHLIIETGDNWQGTDCEVTQISASLQFILFLRFMRSQASHSLVSVR